MKTIKNIGLFFLIWGIVNLAVVFYFAIIFDNLNTLSIIGLFIFGGLGFYLVFMGVMYLLKYFEVKEMGGRI